MNERVTLISLFDEEDTKKIKNFIKNNNIKLCKVLFGKKVDDRIKADTLPYHFTIFSQNIKREIINFLQNFKFKPFYIIVNSIDIVNGNEGSYNLRSSIKNNRKLYKLQKIFFDNFSSKYYNPENFKFHITIHIDKDYEMIVNLEDNMKKNFKPFKLKVQSIGLFEIYPTNLVKIINFN